jgi:hypothetical protein
MQRLAPEDPWSRLAAGQPVDHPPVPAAELALREAVAASEEGDRDRANAALQRAAARVGYAPTFLLDWTERLAENHPRVAVELVRIHWPSTPVAEAVAGQVAAALRRPVEARSHLERAMAAGVNEPRTLRTWVRITGDCQAVATAVQDWPEDAELLLANASCLAEAGELGRAAAVVRGASISRASRATRAGAALILAREAANAGRRRAARRLANRAARLDPENQEAPRLLAQLTRRSR